LYLEAVARFARQALTLPDHPLSLKELRLLERTVHRSGKDTVDHPRHGHDDYANAALGCAVLAGRIVCRRFLPARRSSDCSRRWAISSCERRS
jgi:hypothetical protein